MLTSYFLLPASNLTSTLEPRRKTCYNRVVAVETLISDAVAWPQTVGSTWPTRQLTCASRTIPYILRQSQRARSASLSIRPETGLVVTVPAFYSSGQLSQLLHRHRSWVLRYIDRFAATASRLPKRWPYGPTLPYRGDEYLVRLETQREPAVQTTPQRNLLVGMPTPGIEAARRLLKRWYLEEATRWLQQRTAIFGHQLDIAWRRMRVGDQRSRWGSCSAAGHLSFNYRLVMAPAAVMDYVVIHELLHRRELNHSRRFWALVASHCPDYRASLSWLKTHGPYLGI